MSLEKIVRPAQTPDTAPARAQSRNRTHTGWTPVKLSFGGGPGQIKTLSGHYNLSITYYAIKKPKEDAGGSGGSFLGITFP